MEGGGEGPDFGSLAGWLKGSHRRLDPALSTPLRPVQDETQPEPVPAGDVVRYDIEVWPTSYVFRRGNMIRVEIANGDSVVADGLFHHYYGHRA
ncbi:MAG TPA: CocE/NonD family hydrolase C-terminal non-catalytic domain-containing protein [Microlunatus sp.]